MIYDSAALLYHFSMPAQLYLPEDNLQPASFYLKKLSLVLARHNINSSDMLASKCSKSLMPDEERPVHQTEMRLKSFTIAVMFQCWHQLQPENSHWNDHFFSVATQIMLKAYLSWLLMLAV